MELPLQSALLVAVPEAEEAVARHRASFDEAAAFGVPAHVTVLFPFMPPAEIDPSVVERLAGAISTVPRFVASFESTGWFGTNVLWLAPEPATSFDALISAVADAFPDYPPFGGRHDVVVPHLTVGHGAAVSDLRAAEEAVRRCLPVHTYVTEVALWSGRDVPGGWSRQLGLPLG